MRSSKITLIHAAAIRDALGTQAQPGSLLIRNGQIVAAGHPDQLPNRLVRKATQIIEKPDHLILPAFVNAHAHLDLTTIGPVPYPVESTSNEAEKSAPFRDWLKYVMTHRPADNPSIAVAVVNGLKQSRAAGVTTIGDIAGTPEAIIARRQADASVQCAGVSYLECFGFGEHGRAAFESAAQTLIDMDFESPVPHRSRGVILGLQPHAPYSASPEVYRQSVEFSRQRIVRLSTHMAESLDELTFTRDAAGPFADLLRDLGKWSNDIKPTRQHPVDQLDPVLKRGRWLLAHCNHLDEHHMDILHRTGSSVVYCPIASDYFGHTHPEHTHPYEALLEHGVNVCLGTDSILCQPADEPQPMSILAQMRYLHRRDLADPETLLAMATVNGMIALEHSETDSTLRKGAPAQFVSVAIDNDSQVDPLIQALTNAALVEPMEVTD